MRIKFNKLIIKLLWATRPLITWFDHTFTIKSAIKKVTGDDYYVHRDLVVKGMVFITDANGHGSNIINPSRNGRHGAIYFGRGLETKIKQVLTKLNTEITELKYNPGNDKERAELLKKAEDKFFRIHKVFNDYKINDEICYVIESVEAGVKPTNLVTFMTSKDLFMAFTPNFYSSPEEKLQLMNDAADFSVEDLGLPYDYGFEDGDDAKYCFEVPADNYIKAKPGLTLKKEKVLGHPFYLSTTWIEDGHKWSKTIHLPIANKLL